MKIWFTITGLNHYHGQDFLEKGMKVRLEKEPDNKYDREAIKVLMDGVGHIGYVANSTWTVLGESYSAGRLYDKIGDTARGKVKLITNRGVLCTLKKKDPEKDPKKVPEQNPENHVLPDGPVPEGIPGGPANG
ncbi:MAG: HIRAN domain-containing protein [Clostridiales bacterium]|nr:HIRAN domain-containing protein [Clostridiales bacterium]